MLGLGTKGNAYILVSLTTVVDYTTVNAWSSLWNYDATERKVMYI